MDYWHGTDGSVPGGESKVLAGGLLLPRGYAYPCGGFQLSAEIVLATCDVLCGGDCGNDFYIERSCRRFGV